MKGGTVVSVTSSLQQSSTRGSWLNRQSCSQQVEMSLHSFVFPCNHTWELWQCPEPPPLGTAFPHTILDLRMYGKTPQNLALMFLLPPVRFCGVSSKTRQSNNCLHLLNTAEKKKKSTDTFQTQENQSIFQGWLLRHVTHQGEICTEFEL